jgi:hypothetical protein
VEQRLYRLIFALEEPLKDLPNFSDIQSRDKARPE